MERELQSKIDMHNAAKEDLIKKKAEFDLKLDQARAIVSSKDALIDTMQKNEELVEKEIVSLRE